MADGRPKFNLPGADPAQSRAHTMPLNDPTQDLRALIEQEELRGRSPRRRWLQLGALLGPIVLTITLLTLVGIFEGGEAAWTIVGGMVAIFTLLGKFAIFLGLGEGDAFGPYQIAMLVAYMDICIAVVLVYNLPRLYRLPGLGPKLEDLAEHGQYMLEQRPWLGRVTTFGVVAFVMFPLTGTGAIGGSIFGRLLGLSARRTMIAIAVGAVIGSFGMAFFAGTMESIFTPELRGSWQFKATGLGILLAVIALITWRGRKVSQALKRRRVERAAALVADESDPGRAE